VLFFSWLFGIKIDVVLAVVVVDIYSGLNLFHVLEQLIFIRAEAEHPHIDEFSHKS